MDAVSRNLRSDWNRLTGRLHARTVLAWAAADLKRVITITSVSSGKLTPQRVTASIVGRASAHTCVDASMPTPSNTNKDLIRIVVTLALLDGSNVTVISAKKISMSR